VTQSLLSELNFLLGIASLSNFWQRGLFFGWTWRSLLHFFNLRLIFFNNFFDGALSNLLIILVGVNTLITFDIVITKDVLLQVQLRIFLVDLSIYLSHDSFTLSANLLLSHGFMCICLRQITELLISLGDFIDILEDLILGICELLFLALLNGIPLMSLQFHLLVDYILLHLDPGVIG
jgi:hypothetical protein